MSISSLSSKRFTHKSMYIFTLYRTSVIILTPLPLHPHIHSTVKLCRKYVLQTKREAFFKKMCFQIFLERGEIWRAADVCRKRVPDFSCSSISHSEQVSRASRATCTAVFRISTGGASHEPGIVIPKCQLHLLQARNHY